MQVYIHSRRTITLSLVYHHLTFHDGGVPQESFLTGSLVSQAYCHQRRILEAEDQ